MGEPTVEILLHKMNHLIRSDAVWNFITVIGKAFLMFLNGCFDRSTTQREET